VYACVVDEGMMFLNARTRRYQSLSKRHLPALEQILEGLNFSGSAEPDERMSAELNTALQSQGLLTGDASLGKAFTPIQLPPIDIERSYQERFRRPRIRVWDAVRFAWACFKALWVLGLCSLEWIVRDLTLAPSAGRPRAAEGADLDAQEVAARFRSLGRFFVSSKDRCLYFALALMYFMRLYGQYPTFVIGIRSSPFCPHSWVQDGTVVFDLRPERLSHYTPIVVI